MKPIMILLLVLFILTSTFGLVNFNFNPKQEFLILLIIGLFGTLLSIFYFML